MAGRKARIAGRLLVTLALVAVAGCDGGDGPIPFSQFEPSAEQAVCHLFVLCGDFPDQATCLASEQVQPHYYETIAQDISSGKVVYDGARARTCLDAINALSSCNRSTRASIQRLDPTCSDIFTGTVAAGGGCFVSAECAGGGTCAQTQGTCTLNACCAGTCLGSTSVALGGDCSIAGAVCASGTTCTFDSTSSTDTCQQLAGAGAPCANTTYTSTCAAPFYCDPTSGTCKTPVATGGPCDPSVGSQGCDSPKDQCDTTTSLCTPLPAPGSPCSAIDIACLSYATCDSTTNTCVERPGVGQPCDPTNGPSCLGGTCDPTSATCMLTPTGGACS